MFNSIVKKVNHEKLIFHIHDDIYMPKDNITKIQRIINPIDFNMVKGIIHSADKIITVSYYLEKRFKKFGASNVVTLHNGVLADKLVPISLRKQMTLKEKLGISKKDVVFTFIGRFTSDKGIDKLFSALKSLQNCNNLKCLIVGKNWLHSNAENEYTIKLKKIMKSMPHNLQSRIIFTGYVDHERINEIYSISNCLIIPSQYEEAFGVVALEAMTMGVPIIASNSGGLPEVLGESAVLINRGNNFVSDLTKAIKRVYSNPDLRQRMKYEGKIRSQKFPKNKMEYFSDFIKIVK